MRGVKVFSIFLCFIHQTPLGTSQLSPWYNFYRENSNKMTITDGILPTLSCPFGHYRDFSKGVMLDGCIKCPKGFFGNATNLQSPDCTAPCPPGTYLDRRGGETIEDCIPCPAGTYGEEEGLTDDACSGRCDEMNTFWNRYYSSDKGLASRERKFFPFHYWWHRLISFL